MSVTSPHIVCTTYLIDVELLIELLSRQIIMLFDSLCAGVREWVKQLECLKFDSFLCRRLAIGISQPYATSHSQRFLRYS